jgi:hypothetical protein
MGLVRSSKKLNEANVPRPLLSDVVAEREQCQLEQWTPQCSSSDFRLLIQPLPSQQSICVSASALEIAGQEDFSGLTLSLPRFVEWFHP